MTQAICFKNKFGYCKYQDRCFFRHVTIVCDDAKCDIFKCEKRHPKICKYYRDFGRCKFTLGCKYKHENPYAIFEKFEKILEELKENRIGNQNDTLAKEVDEKVGNFEKMLENQRKELDEKNASILSLELRLDDLEKKYVDEKKNKDKKIKELENAVRIKVNDEKVTETKKPVFKCSDCKFETCSKRGLNVHIRRKHTNLKDEQYPCECEFCDDTLDNESEMKMHLKMCHTMKETNFIFFHYICCKTYSAYKDVLDTELGLRCSN